MKPMSDFVKDKDAPDTNAGDAISRQAAIDAIDEIESEVEDGDGFLYEKWRQYFCDLPSADTGSYRLWKLAYERGKAEAEPERKTGQWLPSRYRDYNECSCCHRITEPQVVAYKFCPYCGAEMRGE